MIQTFLTTDASSNTAAVIIETFRSWDLTSLNNELTRPLTTAYAIRKKEKISNTAKVKGAQKSSENAC